MFYSTILATLFAISAGAALVVADSAPQNPPSLHDLAKLACEQSVTPNTPENVRQCTEFLSSHPEFLFRSAEKKGTEL